MLACVCASPPRADAAGFINLGWSDCAALGPSTMNVTNACTSNSGALDILVGSFEPPVHLDQFVGQLSVVDLQINQATLSEWWHMEAGGCRAGSLTASFDFTGGPYTCTDVWQGQALGGTDYNITGANTARIRTICAVPDTVRLIIDPGNEYYAFKVTINNAKSAGPGGCPGCLDAACLVFNLCELDQRAGLGDYKVTTGPQNVVTYRGGLPGGGCPGVPVRDRSWGEIKSLYR